MKKFKLEFGIGDKRWEMVVPASSKLELERYCEAYMAPILMRAVWTVITEVKCDCTD